MLEELTEDEYRVIEEIRQGNICITMNEDGRSAIEYMMDKCSCDLCKYFEIVMGAVNAQEAEGQSQH